MNYWEDVNPAQVSVEEISEDLEKVAEFKPADTCYLCDVPRIVAVGTWHSYCDNLSLCRMCHLRLENTPKFGDGFRWVGFYELSGAA